MDTKVESSHASDKLSMASKIGYGLGTIGLSLPTNLIALFIVFFYTDVFGLSATIIAVLLLVVRVIEAIFNLVSGYFLDHTRTRWGRFRPYLLFGAIPLAILTAAVFYTPPIEGNIKVVYAFVVYLLLSLVLALVSISKQSLSSSMTQDTHERSILASLAQGFGIGAAMSAALSGSILVGLFPTPQIGFSVVGIVCGIIGIISLWSTFFASHERAEVDASPGYHVRDAYHYVSRNTPLLLLSGTMLVLQIAITTRTSAGLFFYIYNIGQESFFAVSVVISIVFSLTAAVSVPFISKKFASKRSAWIFGAMFGIIGDVGVLLTQPNLPLILTFGAISAFGSGITIVLLWSMVADTVEYGQWKTGVRADGITFATFNFAFRLGTAIGGALSGGILAVTGYVANAEQTPMALWGILAMIVIFPIIANVICVIILRFYYLDHARYQQIVADLRHRRNDTTDPEKPRQSSTAPLTDSST